MNKIELFTGNEFDVQIVMKDNEPWFVASHISKIIDAGNTAMLVSGLDDSEKLVSKIFISGQNRDVILISEAGLYKVLMRSTKPKAIPFQNWLAHEVIPSIRKTGSFGVKELSRKQILEYALQAENELIEANKKLELQAPKVQAFEALMDSDGLLSMSKAAKILGTGRTRLYENLRSHRMIRPDSTEPYQQFVDIGIFEVKATTINDKIKTVTFLTPKGLERVRQFYDN